MIEPLDYNSFHARARAMQDDLFDKSDRIEKDIGRGRLFLHAQMLTMALLGLSRAGRDYEMYKKTAHPLSSILRHVIGEIQRVDDSYVYIKHYNEKKVRNLV